MDEIVEFMFDVSSMQRSKVFTFKMASTKSLVQQPKIMPNYCRFLIPFTHVSFSFFTFISAFTGSDASYVEGGSSIFYLFW